MFDRSLVGPIGTIVKVATLQEYGVDKFFILENNNVDASQRNVVFVARGECGRHAEAIAGKMRVAMRVAMRMRCDVQFSLASSGAAVIYVKP